MPKQGVAVLWSSLGVASGLVMALAAWLMLTPQPGPPPTIPFQDKIFHAVAFAALTGPGVLVLPARYLWFWFAHMIALGAGIEIVQSFSGAGRTGDVVDLAADVTGIAIAFGVGRWMRRRFGENAAQ